MEISALGAAPRNWFFCVFHVSVVLLTHHWITFFFVNFHFCNCGSMSWAETRILCVFMMKRKKETHLSHFFYSVTPLAAAVEPSRRRTLLLCDESLLVLHVDWFLFEHSLDPNGWWGKLEFEWSALNTPLGYYIPAIHRNCKKFYWGGGEKIHFLTFVFEGTGHE